MASLPTQQDAPSYLLKYKLPELHETSETTLNTPHLYVPEKISIVTNYGTQILEKISAELIQQLNDGVTSNGTPTHLRRRYDCTRTPRFTAARAAVILAFDNYYDCMHNYDQRNPLLLPTFLFIPQHLNLLFYTQTSNPSYRTSSYPITFLHTPSRKKRSNEHQSLKERNF